MEDRACDTCGILLPEGSSKSRKYCSEDCKHVANKKEPQKRYCSWCGNEVKSTLRCCSTNCFRSQNAQDIIDDKRAKDTLYKIEIRQKEEDSIVKKKTYRKLERCETLKEAEERKNNGY